MSAGGTKAAYYALRWPLEADSQQVLCCGASSSKAVVTEHRHMLLAMHVNQGGYARDVQGGMDILSPQRQTHRP